MRDRRLDIVSGISKASVLRHCRGVRHLVDDRPRVVVGRQAVRDAAPPGLRRNGRHVDVGGARRDEEDRLPLLALLEEDLAGLQELLGWEEAPLVRVALRETLDGAGVLLREKAPELVAGIIDQLTFLADAAADLQQIPPAEIRRPQALKQLLLGRLEPALDETFAVAFEIALRGIDWHMEGDSVPPGD